jgi:hypothetical protein
MPATFPAHLPWFEHCNNAWMRVEFMKLCRLVQPPVFSSPLVLNILLSTLFSNTASLCSSLNAGVQIPHH